MMGTAIEGECGCALGDKSIGNFKGSERWLWNIWITKAKCGEVEIRRSDLYNLGKERRAKMGSG